MPEEAAAATTTLIVPTQLERSDPWWDCAVGASLFVVAAYLNQHGVSLWWLLPIALPVSLWILTGEAVTDIPFIGAIATGLRTRLGQRRAHEWVLAYLHHLQVVRWPLVQAHLLDYLTRLERR